MNEDSILTINLQQQKALLHSTTSKKYQVIILLMLDWGLRVTEVVKLQCKHINFAKNQISIESQNKE